MIFVFGLCCGVLFCILLFSISLLTVDETETVTSLSKAGKRSEYYTYKLVTKPNATQEDTEFDKSDLVIKLAMEIAPVSNVNLTSISVKVEPSDNAEHGNTKVQISNDTLEDICLDEQNFVLTCKQLSDGCILMTCTSQNELTAQNFKLDNVVYILLEIFSGTSRKADCARCTNVRKTKKKSKASLS